MYRIGIVQDACVSFLSFSSGGTEFVIGKADRQPVNIRNLFHVVGKFLWVSIPFLQFSVQNGEV